MTIAIIQTHSEHDEQTWLGQDMLLALASHDLNPQLILSGAGVLQGCYGHDAQRQQRSLHKRYVLLELFEGPNPWILRSDLERLDRKSTRLNSSHVRISYAVFFLKYKGVS